MPWERRRSRVGSEPFLPALPQGFEQNLEEGKGSCLFFCSLAPWGLGQNGGLFLCGISVTLRQQASSRGTAVSSPPRPTASSLGELTSLSLGSFLGGVALQLLLWPLYPRNLGSGGPAFLPGAMVPQALMSQAVPRVSCQA